LNNNLGANGSLTITNTGSRTALNIDDSADIFARNVTTTNIGANGTIVNLAPATITYVQNDIRSLFVKSGSGGNTFNINGTVNNFSAPLTTLQTGTGADKVNISASGGPMIIEGQSGADEVFAGSANGVQNIRGALRINNAQGSTALTVSDQ